MEADERVRTARQAVRLTACVEATGVQTKARNARIDDDDVGHDRITIVIRSLHNIATKPRRSGREAEASDGALAQVLHALGVDLVAQPQGSKAA